MTRFRSIVLLSLVMIALVGANARFLGADELGLQPISVLKWVESPQQTAQPVGTDYSSDARSGILSGCCDSGCCVKPWYSCYVQAEALYWTRDNATRQPLAVNANNYPVMTTEDLDFAASPGARITLGLVRGPCHCCYAWELGYLGLWDANAWTTIADLDSLYAPADMGFVVNGFINADGMRADYSSDLNSLEVNCVKCCYRRCWTECATCCGKSGGKCDCGQGYVTHRRELDVLCGFRYIAFDEGLVLASDNTREQVDARYDLGTDNDLYGLQLGARWRGYCNRLGLEAQGKAGIYYNDASQHQVLYDQIPTNTVLLRDAKDTSGDVAFLGEFGISLLYEIAPALTLRGGYNLLWLEGVALAPDQLDFAVTPHAGQGIDMAGGVLYHGASLGLEFRH